MCFCTACIQVMCPTCAVYKGVCHAMQFAVCSIFNQNLISDSTLFGACTSSAPVLFLAECLFLFFFSISISSLINHTVAAFLWNIGRRSTINREKDRLFSCPAVSFHALCEGLCPFFATMYSGSLWAVSMYLRECQRDKFFHFASWWKCLYEKEHIGSFSLPAARCFSVNALCCSVMHAHFTVNYSAIIGSTEKQSHRMIWKW